MITGNRAVYYARVSTEEEAQLKALPKQIKECEDIIAANSWVLIRGYVDEGKSGTTANRKEYLKLLEDIEGGEFDIVVAKSQDRLQRNPGDWYIFIDKLIKNNKRLFLYIDGKFFDPCEDALLSGIKAILAAEYSRDLSKKLNNANQRRIERARKGETVTAMGSNMRYGYHIVNGYWEIDHKQAEVVKEVFRLYLELDSIRKVVDALNNEGYRNQRGGLFIADSVSRIIKNPCYKGTQILNRYHRDFDTKKIIENPPEEWVVVDNAFEAIVSPEIWEKANERLALKRAPEKRGKNISRDPLGGKMFCSKCGAVMWRHCSNGYYSWYCSNKMSRGKVACEGVSISQRIIDNLYISLGANLVVQKEVVKESITDWLKSLQERIYSDNGINTQEQEIKRLRAEIKRLVDKYVEGKIPESIYDNKYEELNSKLIELEAMGDNADENEDLQTIENILNNIDNEIDEWIASNDFDKERVNFLKDHTKRIEILPDKVVIIELDLIAGAIVAGKDLLLYVRNSMYYSEHTVKEYKVRIKIAA